MELEQKYWNKFKNIINGWVTSLKPTSENETLARKRASICANCKLNVNNVCTKKLEDTVIKNFNYYGELRVKNQLVKGCGCPLSKKVYSKDDQCPTGKWENI